MNLYYKRILIFYITDNTFSCQWRNPSVNVLFGRNSRLFLKKRIVHINKICRQNVRLLILNFAVHVKLRNLMVMFRLLIKFCDKRLSAEVLPSKVWNCNFHCWCVLKLTRKTMAPLKITGYLLTQNENNQQLFLYIRVNKNPSAWNFLSPKPEITCGTIAIIIRVVLLSPYLRIRAVSLSSIHYNQSHRVYINRRRQYICLIWNQNIN